MRLGRLSVLPVSAAFLVFAVAAASGSPVIPPTADEVFHLSAKSDHPGSLVLTWTIAPDTYLYRDRIAVMLSSQTVSPPLEPGIVVNDQVFGPTEIYRDHLETRIEVPVAMSGGRLTVSYQGCAEHKLCYPPVVKSIDLKTLAIGDAPD
ncbi:MAG: protein-disulfide reductase DsbD family protein [Ancalomicrobiaceae bacterium]|nr:protein-disulfide reductase DsbD family protein [Ancalomicrobiaceae bacterium]